MTIHVGPNGVRGDIFKQLARAEQLAIEFERVARGDLPTADSLADALFLDRWRKVLRPVPCLSRYYHFGLPLTSGAGR